ncbi:hypothetical protein RHSIM_Rhsim07G0115300 [Rhododendron simsii]|uniref:Uncharacterized protein n=1 Tax=Rhododendron simsii TaxID=118357 RepID=A0A834GMX4_RHOSS|nr:hypothetical protein RHSIM_Rhsim07G0115300 [Rhododendron simsii]
MATAPLKSQPLHNFSLPQLRWGHKSHAHVNQRYRRPSDTPTAAAENHHHSPSPSEQESYGGNRDMSRFPMASCSSQKAVIEREEDREKEKPWNLRPRKAVVRIPSNGGELTETAPFSENLPKSTRLRGYVEGLKKKEEEEEKRKYLWIALCREEIEEDVYAMTGSKPARRPKKRPKTVQKQLDNLFPGLYLTGITPDSYRVYDAPVDAKTKDCGMLDTATLSVQVELIEFAPELVSYTSKSFVQNHVDIIYGKGRSASNKKFNSKYYTMNIQDEKLFMALSGT